MTTRLVCSIWLALFASSCLAAQTKSTKLRGTVQDAGTKEPVAGATVSASGDVAHQSEVTDDKGFFRILIEGVVPGDLVRIRVEKPGYSVYDRQVVSSEEIPLDILLRRTTAPGPPPVRKPAVSPDPVVASYIRQMADPLPSIRLNALKVVAGSAPTDSAAMSAVIAAAQDADWRVRSRAVYYIGEFKPGSKEAVTNLIIGLNDISGSVRIASIAALGGFPKDKEAVSALFRVLGTPPEIETRAMDSLVGMGIDDPRLTEALFYEATLGNNNAISALLKKTPLPKELIARLIIELEKSLDSTENFRQQRIINLLLKGGDPARQALLRLLSTTDPPHQSRLVLCWLEVDHGAKAEILQSVHVADLIAELTKAMDRSGTETVYLLEGDADPNTSSKCSYGIMLRAAMGTLTLGLTPRKDALSILAYALLGDHGRECGNYAAIVPRWFPPAVAKPLIPLLANNLLCRPEAQDVDANIVTDTLAEIGDEDTIALLQKLSAQRVNICGNEDYDALGKKHLSNLVLRIRNRTDK